MSQTAPQIIVAYDFSETSELALQHSVHLAAEDGERDFHFLVVLDPNKGLGLKDNEEVNFDYSQEVQELATKHINDSLEKMDPGAEVSMLVHVRIGDPGKEILALAEEVGASLIILGSHGRTGVKRLLLGSVSEEVVRKALCPVMVARNRTYEDVERDTIHVASDEEHGPRYVPPQRFNYKSAAPTRSKAWALY